MKFCYADPPYLGCAALYARHHPEAMIWNDPETHRALIARLCDEYPDGWALSLGENSTRIILPMCPPDIRVGAWVKTWCSFKPGVNPAYAWEPVMFRGGRKRRRFEPTVRNWVSAPATMMRGMPGAKPEAFCAWIFDMLNMHPTDEFHDIFPGSGAVTRAWEEWKRQPRLKLSEKRPRRKGEMPLFA